MKKNSGILTFFLSIFIFGFLIFKPAFSQDAALIPPAVQQFFDSSGNPLASGKVYFYQVGTSTFKDVYNSSAATTSYTNPITLNAGGKPPGGSGIYGIGLYRQVVKDKNGNTIWDAVTAPGGGSGGTPTSIGDGNAVGTVLPWGGLVAPSQYVFTYGQELIRTDYPEFYSAITLQTNVICTASSNTLTGISDTSQIPVGADIELSLCVPPGSTVVSKTSGTVTLNNPANVSLNATARFFPYGNGDGSTTFNVPDLRDVVLAGRPNMGGSDRGLITSTYFGTDPAALGALGGSQTVTLSISNLPAYTPEGRVSLSTVNPLYGNLTTGLNIQAGTTNPGAYNPTNVISQLTGTFIGTPQGGTRTPFSVIQPTLTFNYIIKVTPDTPMSTEMVVTELGGMTGVISCGIGLTCADQTISVNSFGEATTAIKIPVKAASTVNVALFGPQTIDGVSVVAGDRVLVKDQSTASENGIYVVSNSNWTRATDFNETGEVVQGSRVSVSNGITNANIIFYITSNNPIIIGSSAINFSSTTSANASLLIGFSGSAGHSMPYLVLKNIDDVTPNGAGGHIIFESLNSSGVLKDAVDINCGLIVATAGNEQGDCDFSMYINGSIKQVVLSGSTTGGQPFWSPADNDLWDLGVAHANWRTLFLSRDANVGGTTNTENLLVGATTTTLLGPNTHAVFHAATDKNLFISTNFTRSTGVSLWSVTDASVAQPIEYIASEHLFTSGGLVIGAATGGTQGIGTINATGLYINGNSVLSGGITALTGDATATGPGSASLTLATVNSNVGSFGNSTQAPQFTVNGKGLITAASNVTITPAVGSITGLGTGVASWLATPSSANLRTALTDETGGGSAVFADAPTLTNTLTVSNSGSTSTTTYTDILFQNSAGYNTDVRHGLNWTGGGGTNIGYFGISYDGSAYTKFVMRDMYAGVATTTEKWAFWSNTHLSPTGNAPTLSSCGTTPSISGTDFGGEVTMGTGTPTGCTITFATSYVSAPYCTVAWQSNLASMQYTVALDKITINQTATSSNKINYQCTARSGG